MGFMLLNGVWFIISLCHNKKIIFLSYLQQTKNTQMKNIQKYYILIPACLLIAFSFSCSHTDIKTLQSSYIPSPIPDIYIGMNLKEFKESRGIENLSMTQKGGMTIYKEESTKDSITLYQYHFDKKKKLKKLIIEYIADYELYEAFKTKYGEQNSGKAWLVVLNKKLSLLIWTQNNTLIITDNKLFKN